MSSLWWLEPGWKQTTCAQCGGTIWPQGDPDWGLCYGCKMDEHQHRMAEAEYYEQMEQNRYKDQ